MSRISTPLVILFLIFLYSGCSQSGSSPVSPESQDNQPQTAISTAGSVSSHQLWGYWQCELDPSTGEITAVPARTSQIHLNIARLIDTTMGMTITVLMDESDPQTGYFVARMGITHPFPGMTEFSAFDVRVILITTAQYSSGDFNFPGPNDPSTLNADGYTRWWNPVDFPVPGIFGYTPGKFGKEPPPGTPLESSINPYKQFATALTDYYKVFYLTTVPPTSELGRGVLHDDATNFRKWELQFPVTPEGLKIYFNYAIDVSWEEPDNIPPDVPNDFPLNANCPEAFIVDAEATGNTLWAITGSPLGGGELSLEIECWDWQGWLDDYEGQIGALRLLSPFCEFDDNITPTITDPGTGKVVLTATVPGIPTASGLIPVWVGVTAPETSYKQSILEAPDENIVAYDLIEVEVSVPECEDNESDDCTTAWNINPEESVDGQLCLTVDESDWYKFHVNTTGSAYGTIELTMYDVSDMNLLLYKGCPGELVDFSSTAGTDDEILTVESLTEGDYYIEILLDDDILLTPLAYGLTTSIIGIGENCTTDNNNSYGTADDVALSTAVDDFVCLIGDPVDWFTFEISESETGFGSIDLRNLHYANNDIALFDDTVTSPLFVGNQPGSLDEHLDIPTLEAGTYYIRIDAMDDDPVGDRPYSLEMALEETVINCDDSDGNNTWDTAEDIALVETRIGTVCSPSDPDWYTFDVPEGGADGSITLNNMHAYDNDLYLYDDPLAPPIYESAAVGTMSEMIEFTELPEGAWYIKAKASDATPSQDQDYELTTDMTTLGPSPTDFYVHAFIVRTNSGTEPAASEAKVQDDMDWASEFFQIWFDGSVTLYEISYINKTSWLSLTVDESWQMFQQHHMSDGTVNVFYVNDFPDMQGAAAYTLMQCQYSLEDSESCYIAMCDYGTDMVFAHELGHAGGLLADMYWFDYGYNCGQISWCDTGPSGIFCMASDAEYGNLMYWPTGTEVGDYWVSNTDIGMSTPTINSQAENMMYFNTNWPNAFHEP